jgi:hypothetical protein
VSHQKPVEGEALIKEIALILAFEFNQFNAWNAPQKSLRLREDRIMNPFAMLRPRMAEQLV